MRTPQERDPSALIRPSPAMKLAKVGRTVDPIKAASPIDMHRYGYIYVFVCSFTLHSHHTDRTIQMLKSIKACMYIRICTHMHMCIWAYTACMYMCTFVYISIYRERGVYIQLYVCTHMCVYVYTYVHVHVYMYIHIYVYTCIYTYIYIRIYMYICTVYSIYYSFTHVCVIVPLSTYIWTRLS